MILVFDLSGVFFDNGLSEAVKHISSQYRLDAKEVEDTLNGRFAEQYRIGLLESDKFWEQARSRLGVEYIEGIRRIFFDSYHPHIESQSLIERLRSHNVRVGYLSDSPKDRTDYLDNKYHFIARFDFGLFSYEAHARKPSTEIYRALLDRFQLDPGNVVYIDDKKSNLQPAEALGMKCVLFEDVVKLERTLKELGVKF